jgi:hypothetical protein
MIDLPVFGYQFARDYIVCLSHKYGAFFVANFQAKKRVFTVIGQWKMPSNHQEVIERAVSNR